MAAGGRYATMFALQAQRFADGPGAPEDTPGPADPRRRRGPGAGRGAGVAEEVAR